MQKFGKTIITNAGRQMLTQVDGAKGKITYTKASLCSQDVKKLSEDDCLALAALTGVQMDTNLEVTDVRDNTVTVLASFNNANVTKDLTFNSIGWFAKTSVDDTEKLLAITPSETEQTLVAGKNGASTSSTDIEMIFSRSHDTTVVVNPSSVGLVSKAQLSSATDKINNDINSLSALTSPSSIVSNQTINLDTFTTRGITRFQNAQLSSVGYMQAFDQSTTGLNGWIFNIYSNDGASYIQIVYITNTAYNQGAMYFLRSKVNGTSTEDFARLSTIKDHAQFFPLTQRDAKDVVARDENKSFNPDNVVDSGVHRISSTKINAKYDVTDPKDPNSGYSFSGFYWGWLFNLNFDDSPTSNAVYQLIVINSGIYFREISVKTNDFPAFNSFSFAKDIAKLQTAIDNLLKTKVNFSDLIGYISDHNGNRLVETTGNANSIGEPGIYFTKGGIKNLPLTNWGILQVIGITATDSASAHRKVQIYYPDDLGIMPYYRNVTNTNIGSWHQFASQDDITSLINKVNTLGAVKKVNNKLPGADGNVTLSSFENPDFVYTKKDTLDVDKATTPGIYSLMDTTLTCSINTNALSAVPGNTDGKTYTGYLKVYKHDAANITQELRIYTGRTVPDFTTSTRCIYGNSNYRPNFQRSITDIDYKSIINYIDDKEVVHQCADLTTGIAYSKANPNIIVATP